MLKSSSTKEALQFHNIDKNYALNIDEYYEDEEDEDEEDDEKDDSEYMCDLSVESNGVKRKQTKNLLKKKKKTKGRVKIKMEFIENKIRRYTTFSKRKTGIMKKAYELSTLTGTQVMLLVASETGHVYTFATDKLQPMITSDAGKSLIQSCLSSSTISEEDSFNDTCKSLKIATNYLNNQMEKSKNDADYSHTEFHDERTNDEEQCISFHSDKSNNRFGSKICFSSFHQDLDEQQDISTVQNSISSNGLKYKVCS